MAIRSDILRWLVLGMSATTLLMVGQLIWLLQDHRNANRFGLRWQQSIDKRAPAEREITASNSGHLEKEPRLVNIFNSTSSHSGHFNQRFCIPDTSKLPSPTRTHYKIFIYDLPRKFNYDILECVTKNECFDLDFCGMGEELYRIGNISVRNTNQFALEVVLHHQLLFSPYRVLNPSEADVFYIPAYTGLSCFCHHQSGNKNTTFVISELFHWLEQQKYYMAGKMHLSTLAKIEREQASERCPLLKFPQSRNIVYATIEEESSSALKGFLHIVENRVIVVPYPSYGHIVSGATELNQFETVPSPSYEDRRVFVFLAAGARRSNTFRTIIMDQFPSKSRTKMSYDEYFSRSVNEDHDTVFLYTQECQGDHHRTTIGWMQRSVFCLQPPGDSPTRKSFYDTIIAGCIPVLFQGTTFTDYPFQTQINYEKFTVTISNSDIETKKLLVRKILSEIPQQEIRAKLKAVQSVAQKLQYTVPSDSTTDLKGATDLLMKEIGYTLATWQMDRRFHAKGGNKLHQN